MDMGMLGLATAALLAFAPRGDGHPVLVIPGLLATNRSTSSLRRFLGYLGYDARGWSLGRNLGPRSIGAQGDKLEAELARITQETQRKVSIVGWSLGGIMARIVSQRSPEAVRQVISMGSGFGGQPQATNASAIYAFLSGERIEGPVTQALAHEASRQPEVPSTSIFARGDGIVSWQNCLGPQNDRSENIRVRGSHCGLGFNPAVWYAVADRLAQSEDNWRPFSSPPMLKGAFPDP
jgi:pimeloyl-ACP methyl ester carboxylesterase